MSGQGTSCRDAGSRALYATDLSIYQHVPIGVVIPRHVEDVIETVAVCRRHGVPILGRGCGTSLAGQTCNVAVVIDFSKYMNRLLELDPAQRWARVQPGLINDQLREAASRHGLTFAPDPATHAYCTLGGNIGNNSCGAHTVMGGKTVDNVEELEILTYDGLRLRVGPTSSAQFQQVRDAGGRPAQIYESLQKLAGHYAKQIRERYPDIPRRVSGYNLDDLLPEKGFNIAHALVGSESTCALTLSAKVRLIEAPAAAAREALSALKRAGSASLEARVFEDATDQSDIWHVRESGVGASRVPGEEEAWPSWEDAAVPPRRLGQYLREFEQLNHRFGYRYTLFGHFGDGCVHARMTFGLRTAEGVRKFRSYMQEAADLCLAHGGSLSGEHGDGQAKGELLPRMFGPELIQAFREFKRIWDPQWRMNPGKLIDARPLDADLRLGADYRARPVSTHLHFPEDQGSFAHAAERCFGVGKCRMLGAQTMCPSFQATREERYSTRGRAHLLFEMMRGDTIRDGWRSEAVREALDLCLQCKGCKHDCPVSVDMATYKAEFLSHYYAGRLRPRAAYSPRLEREALVQLHCHHRAVLNADAELELLRDMGLKVETPSAGCCGRAGAFGYEREHHDVSMQIGELSLLPAVRRTSRESFIVADGFSCRQQIRDGSGRWAMHPVELIALALQSGDAVPHRVPERRYLERAARPHPLGVAAAAVLALGAGLALARLARRSLR